MKPPEFSRRVRLRDIGGVETLMASAEERSALARRFGLRDLDLLEAVVTMRREAGGVRATGRVRASVVQACALSDADVAGDIDEPIDLLFAAEMAPASPDEEIELTEADLDVLPLDGDAIELGEAVAQTLGLALDPFPRSVDIGEAAGLIINEEEAERRAASDKAARSPFAVLRPN